MRSFRALVWGVVVTSLLALALPAAPAPGAVVAHRWDAEGNVLDAVGLADGGALMGDATFTTGHVGQAFSFDGAGDYVSVPTAAITDILPGTSSFTVDAWASTTAMGPQPIVSMYECAGFCTDALSSSWYTIAFADGRATTYLRDFDKGGAGGSEGEGLSGGPLINDGTLHHVGVMRDVEGARLVLFVDAVAVADVPLGPGAAGAITSLDGDDDPLTIGGQILGGTASLNTALSGRVDEARIWVGAESFDKTPPAPLATMTGAHGRDDWFIGDVGVTWDPREPSVLRSSSGCGATSVTTDTPGASLTCTATSVAGTGSASVTVKRDATAPVVTCPAAPTFDQGASGFVSASVADATSGPEAAAVSAAAPTAIPGEGSIAVTGRDLAGNTTTVSCAFTVKAAPPPPRPVSISSIATLPPAKACVSRRKFPIRLRGVKVGKIVRAQINLNGKQVRNVVGNALSLPIDLRGLPKGKFSVEIITTDSGGKRLTGKRTYRTCVPKRR